jgi:hypothetical protein
LIVCFGGCLGARAAEQQFRQFAAQYGKSYASDEFGSRLNIFKVNQFDQTSAICFLPYRLDKVVFGFWRP